jgi:hypothetical protein
MKLIVICTGLGQTTRQILMTTRQILLLMRRMMMSPAHPTPEACTDVELVMWGPERMCPLRVNTTYLITDAFFKPGCGALRWAVGDPARQCALCYTPLVPPATPTCCAEAADSKFLPKLWVSSDNMVVDVVVDVAKYFGTSCGV